MAMRRLDANLQLAADSRRFAFVPDLHRVQCRIEGGAGTHHRGDLL